MAVGERPTLVFAALYSALPVVKMVGKDREQGGEMVLSFALLFWEAF